MRLLDDAKRAEKKCILMFTVPPVANFYRIATKKTRNTSEVKYGGTLVVVVIQPLVIKAIFTSFKKFITLAKKITMLVALFMVKVFLFGVVSL